MKRTRKNHLDDSNKLILRRETLRKLTDDVLNRAVAGTQAAPALTQIGCDPHARIEIIEIG